MEAKQLINHTCLETIRKQFQKLGLPISEYSSTNVFLFRKVHQYALWSIENRLFIHGSHHDAASYCMPMYDLREECTEFLQQLCAQVDMIFPIPEIWVPALREKGFYLTADDADSDYVYRTDVLCLYPGRQLASRRNLVYQFTRLYTPALMPMTQENAALALSCLSVWSSRHQIDGEHLACQEALTCFDTLSLQGLLVLVEGVVVGFIIGEPLTQDMFMVHFAKGDVAYKGIYQYMYQEFAKSVQSFTFMNWAQDLGIAGLKQSKRSYLPDHMEKKYRMRRYEAI